MTIARALRPQALKNALGAERRNRPLSCGEQLEGLPDQRPLRLQLLGDRALFTLLAEQSFHRIRGRLSGFMVVANLHLAWQANGQHVQAGQQKHGSEDHRRSVLGHNIGVVPELVENQP